MISQKTIQDINDTAKVEDIVGEFVTLKRSGSNMKGLCPFHNEKTPSFMVSPAKNLYKCFGCGKGGGPIQFLIDHEQLSYPESLRYLAKRYSIEIEETQSSNEDKAERQYVDSLFLVNDYAKQFFEDQLLKTEIGRSVALSYFKERGYLEDTIQKFGLGYSPAPGDIFTKQAIAAGYKPEMLKDLGLTSQYGKDFFRDRVMFSIFNQSGKVVGFAGRILGKNKKAPKYINSPETKIYNKSKTLYGLHLARKTMRTKDECIIVEGYTDVISLYQGGVENVVASSGTSLTEGQINLVKRYTPNIKFLYDGDKAGIKAALRGLDMVLEQDMNVRVVLLPDEEDPDSYMKRVGAAAFEEYMNTHAQDFILFKTNLLLEEAEGDPIKKAALVRDIVESIAKMPDPIKRSIFLKECSRVLDVGEQALVTETNKEVLKNIQDKKQRKDRAAAREARQAQRSKQNNRASSGGTPFPMDEPPFDESQMNEGGGYDIGETDQLVAGRAKVKDEYHERDIIRLLVVFGNEVMVMEEQEVTVSQYVLSNIEEVIESFEDPLYQKVARECYQRLVNEQPINKEVFLRHEEADVKELTINLMTSPYDYSPGWDERELPLQYQKEPDLNFKQDALESVARFTLKRIEKLCDENQKRIKEAFDTGEMERGMQLLKVQQALIEKKKEVALQTGSTVVMPRGK